MGNFTRSGFFYHVVGILGGMHLTIQREGTNLCWGKKLFQVRGE